MSLPKFTPHMISNQPDQTAYLLNKLVQEGVGGTGGGGGDIHLYPGTGQHTDGAMTQKATTDALGLKADSSTVSAQLAGKVDKEAGKGLSSNDFTDEEQTKLANIPTNIMTTDTAQTVTGTKTFHNAEVATDNMITLKNNSTSLIRGMSGIEYRQLLKRGSTDVEVGNTHDPLALKGSGTRPKYNSTNLLIDSDLDDVVFAGTGSVGTLSPWVDTSDIVDGAVTHAKLAEEAAIGRPIELFHGNNVDLNTMTESGIHRFYTPYTNGPSGTYTYCTMLVMNYSDDYRCSQYFTGIDDNGSGVIAVRFSFFYMGTARGWSNWKVIAQWPD